MHVRRNHLDPNASDTKITGQLYYAWRLFQDWLLSSCDSHYNFKIKRCSMMLQLLMWEMERNQGSRMSGWKYGWIKVILSKLSPSSLSHWHTLSFFATLSTTCPPLSLASLPSISPPWTLCGTTVINFNITEQHLTCFFSCRGNGSVSSGMGRRRGGGIRRRKAEEGGMEGMRGGESLEERRGKTVSLRGGWMKSLARIWTFNSCFVFVFNFLVTFKSNPSKLFLNWNCSTSKNFLFAYPQ